MRISDWSSDVCSSYLIAFGAAEGPGRAINARQRDKRLSCIIKAPRFDSSILQGDCIAAAPSDHAAIFILGPLLQAGLCHAVQRTFETYHPGHCPSLEERRVGKAWVSKCR